MKNNNRKIKKVNVIIEYEDGYEEEGELELGQSLTLTDLGSDGRTKVLVAAKLQAINWNNNHPGIQEIKLELSNAIQVLPKT